MLLASTSRLTLGIFRNNGYENNPNWLSMSTSNTRYELNYHYTWDEIVEKFEYLGECDDDDFYKNVLSNKQLYREYKLAKSRLPYLRRALKREPDAGHDVDLEKMLGYIEKYNNLAREASSNGDKILSENYLQHAEHFIRNSSNFSNDNAISSNPSSKHFFLKESNSNLYDLFP